jgi:hypothetical protein
MMTRRGQALIELAVFGALVLMLIGWVIGNTLQYDYQMQANTEAYRRSLASAAGSSNLASPISVSHVVIQDRRIADPGEPFAMGGLVPASGSANVTRKYNLNTRPEEITDLPRMAVRIEGLASGCPGVLGGDPGSQTCYYTLAGFRDEFGVPQESLDRYRFIFGESSVCDKPSCCGGGPCGNGACLEWVDDIDPETGGMVTVCLRYSKNIRILDSCAGEILSRSSCLARAATIVDSGMCTASCVRAGKSGCAVICAQPMQIPNYAAGAFNAGGQWVSPGLDALLSGAESAGVQPGNVQVLTTDSSIGKFENPGGITSVTTLNATDTVTRTVIRAGAADNLDAVKDRDDVVIWNTPW